LASTQKSRKKKNPSFLSKTEDLGVRFLAQLPGKTKETVGTTDE
jgi:hypothetical protein